MPPITTAESQESQTSSILKERRFKLSRACDRCRRRRIKCDEGHPCQACLTASSACTFEEPGKRTHPHKSKRTATLEDRMHHLETLIQAIPPAVFAAGAFNGVPADTSKGTAGSPFPSFPNGIPPPSLHVFPLTNPSTHFKHEAGHDRLSPTSAIHAFMGSLNSYPQHHSSEQLAEETARMSLSTPYLYFDDEGYTRWQGETSGLPLLDLLLERHSSQHSEPSDGSPHPDSRSSPASGSGQSSHSSKDWFPNRTPRRTDINPQNLWRLITNHIVPELMDSLVQCYLSTSYYILPFLHVPTFLSDYGNPQKWGEPGFAAFIVAICCLASRHMDDPRVRADPTDPISAGTHWFELLGRLRTLPIADRPTLYTIQADLIAAIYAVGLGRLSKAAALLSEAVTVSIDAGLHRSADTFDLFDPIEDEVRKRTFWCVYIWDKQLSAHFGRPPMIRLRDCDVSEPSPVDDEFITKETIGTPPPGTECRLSAFICSLRIMVVLESVLDIPPVRSPDTTSQFLQRAGLLFAPKKGFLEMREEEAMLDEIHMSIPTYWAHTAETLVSEDTIRITQSGRLHCAEHFVRLLIYRHRFSQLLAERTQLAAGSGSIEGEPREAEREAVIAAHNSALQIITSHLNVARKGLMTYYGVHVIHQLTQAGRTLVAVLLNCKSEALQPLIPSGLDALRSCVGLLRRFSGRYVCGLRSGDLMEEFCRLTQIPLETSSRADNQNESSRLPWIRPVRKKNQSIPRSSQGPESNSSGGSPEGFSPSDFFNANPEMPSKPVSPSSTFRQPSGSPSVAPQNAFNVNLPVAVDSSAMDTSGALGLSGGMDLMRDDLYMSSFFDTASNGLVDVGQMFTSPDFINPPDLELPGATGAGPYGAANGNGFLKMNGLVASP